MQGNFLGTESSNISYHTVRNILTASVQGELLDETVKRLQTEILDGVFKNEFKGVVIDVSNVEIIDTFISRKLIDISKMVKLLGARTLFTGIRLDVVASMVELGTGTNDMQVALNVDSAIETLSSANQH